MKKISIFRMLCLIVFSVVGIQAGLATEPSIGQYTKYPIFMTQSVKPNILIILDNSGSMNCCAYGPCPCAGKIIDNTPPYAYLGPGYEGNNTTVYYYGYFDPKAQYSYSDSNKQFERDPSGKWSGNWLNWLTMRRIDIARKVLVGGRATPRIGNGKGEVTLWGDNTTSSVKNFYYVKKFDNNNSTEVNPYTDNTISIDTLKGTITVPADYYYILYGGYILVVKLPHSIDDIPGFKTFEKIIEQIINFLPEDLSLPTHINITPLISLIIPTYRIAVKKDASQEPNEFLNGNIAGIVQRMANKVRWGMEFFNNDNEGGKIHNRVGGNLTNLITNIENEKADTATPLAEAFYEGTRYFEQIEPYYNSGDYKVNDTYDPYYWKSIKGFVPVPCEKSFVLLITDGNSTQDTNIPDDPDDPSHPDNLKDYDGDGNDNTTTSHDGTDYLDDVALWAHTTDLRTKKPELYGMQNLTLYVISTFGSGSQLLKDAAKNGGFIDENGNKRPDLRNEWDKNGDAIPDTYFEAENGYEMEAQILEAITEILRRAASGTSVSVLATSNTGEGSLVQAYFRPSITSGTSEVDWIGYLQSVWVDNHGNMREDTNGNHALDIDTDRILKYFISPDGDTKVKCFDVNSTNPYLKSDTYTVHKMDEIKPIWRAGKVLSQTDPGDRKIFTFIDKNNDQVIDDETGETDDPFDSNDEVVKFDVTDSASLGPYLGLNSTKYDYLGSNRNDRISNLIEYICGKDTGLTGTTHIRPRTIDGRVWKLGDIVHSTPVPVGIPSGDYGIIYGDESYKAYYNKYRDRETVVYVGANDGMLHAFTSGKYDETSKRFNEVDGTPLGTELWAYIPQALLPHLKWLADPNYTHVYYVDLRPKITDAKIFDADDTHPNGWGTVLIGGLNMGGKDISVTDDFGYNGTDTTRIFFPSYFAIDVTDPRNPRLLWERHYKGLGFSSSCPTILKVKDKWFAAFGSGPTDYDGSSTQKGHIFVVHLKTGEPYGNNSTDDWLFKTDEDNAFMSGPVALDTGDTALNYNVDAIYIGEAYKQTNWKGALYKVAIPWINDAGNDTKYGDTTNGHYIDHPTDASNPWQCSRLFDSPAPITVPAALSVDSLDNIWIYFGTGRYFNDSDKSSKDQQYFFGIKDPFFNSSDTTYYHNYSSSCTLNKDDLFDADPYTVNNDGTVEKNGSANGTFTDLLTDVQKKDGWFRSLNATDSSPSERVLTKSSVVGGIVSVPTFVPNGDICRFGGDSYLYGFYYETGTAYWRPVFEDGATGKTVSDEIELGPGLPSSISTDGGKDGSKKHKDLVQLSTGVIKDITVHSAFTIKSGLRSWREK